MHELPIPAAIERALSGLPPAIRNRILERLQSLTDYEPVIGIAGKSGAGKSSLCNALFSGEVSPVSDVLACTRDALRFRLKADKHSLMIIDLPGAGESEVRDRQYAELYQSLLPEMDLVLWVIKADDRALSVDEKFYREVIGPYRDKVLFVVSQVDRFEPLPQGASAFDSPSVPQRHNLSLKLEGIRERFAPIHPLCAVSARTRWGIAAMVSVMMACLPDKATSPVTSRLHKSLRTENIRGQARERFGRTVGDMLDTVARSSAVSAPTRNVIQAIRDIVVRVARSLWDFFF